MRREGCGRDLERDCGRDVPVRDQLIDDMHDLQRASIVGLVTCAQEDVSLTHTQLPGSPTTDTERTSHFSVAAYHNKARRGYGLIPCAAVTANSSQQCRALCLYAEAAFDRGVRGAIYRQRMGRLDRHKCNKAPPGSIQSLATCVWSCKRRSRSTLLCSIQI